MEQEFEKEWQRYCDAKGGGAVTMNIKEVAHHFAEWGKKQAGRRNNSPRGKFPLMGYKTRL